VNWPCSGKVKGIDEAEGCCSSSTTRSQVTQEVAPELCIFVDTAQENLLVLVLESKVEGLCGKVPNDVGEITTPVAKESLLSRDADKTVDHSCKDHKDHVLILSIYLKKLSNISMETIAQHSFDIKVYIK